MNIVIITLFSLSLLLLLLTQSILLLLRLQLKYFSGLFTHEMIFTVKKHDLHFANNPT